MKKELQQELQEDLNKHSLEYVKHTVEEVKRLRYWFAGFEAAGGKLPVCERAFSALHKAHLLLEEYASLVDKHK